MLILDERHPSEKSKAKYASRNALSLIWNCFFVSFRMSRRSTRLLTETGSTSDITTFNPRVIPDHLNALVKIQQHCSVLHLYRRNSASHSHPKLAYRFYWHHFSDNFLKSVWFELYFEFRHQGFNREDQFDCFKSSHFGKNRHSMTLVCILTSVSITQRRRLRLVGWRF